MDVKVKCMHGIGDNLYSRPFISMLSRNATVYLDTPVPFLFTDLQNVKFLETSTAFRTQKKGLEEFLLTNKFDESPNYFAKEIDYVYGEQDLVKHGIIAHFEKSFGFEVGSTKPTLSINHYTSLPQNFYLPSKPIAVVRPVTHRKEWLCTSRSPEPKYVAWCARQLKDMGYYVISIADCIEGEEWIETEGEPIADLKLHHGELGINGTLALIEQADVVVGGSGFIVPAAIATQTPLFIIFGGRGGYDNPHKILDLRLNLKKVGWALPTDFCRCRSMNHPCNKEIKDLDSQFMRFMVNV